MKIVGTEKETDWLIEALAVAGCCGDCPAREHCHETDEREEQRGVPEGERTSCGEMLRDVIEIKNKKERQKKRKKGGFRAARKSTV